MIKLGSNLIMKDMDNIKVPEGYGKEVSFKSCEASILFHTPSKTIAIHIVRSKEKRKGHFKGLIDELLIYGKENDFKELILTTTLNPLIREVLYKLQFNMEWRLFEQMGEYTDVWYKKIRR